MTTSPTAMKPVTSAVLADADIQGSLDDATATAAKAITCGAIAACPVRLWPRLSALVRRIWSGFRNA